MKHYYSDMCNCGKKAVAEVGVPANKFWVSRPARKFPTAGEHGDGCFTGFRKFTIWTPVCKLHLSSRDAKDLLVRNKKGA